MPFTMIYDVDDYVGTRAPGNTSLVTVTVASGSGTLRGTTSVAAVDGRVTFPNLKITGSGPHELTFSIAGEPFVVFASVFVSP